jgi:CBS domain-containing protein
MFWNRRKTKAERAAETAHAVSEQVGRGAQVVQARTGLAVEAVKERLPEVRERAGDLASQVRQQAAPAARATAERGGEVAEEVRDWSVTAAKAAAAGAALAAKYLAERSEDAGHALREGGHVVAGRLPRRTERRRKGRSTMAGKLMGRFALGFGVGYVLGTRAGRERYDQIVRAWKSLIGSPTVHQAAERGKEIVADMGRSVGHQVQARMDRQTVRDVMTPNPRIVRANDPVVEAARAMKDVEAGAVVVTDDSGEVTGIVTDRDIAIRSIAEGRDPTSTPVKSIASMDVTTLSPSDSARDAVRLMRDKAIRRLPVVDEGRPVGIVSLGDLAVERDSDSVLAAISAAPDNTENGGSAGTRS